MQTDNQNIITDTTSMASDTTQAVDTVVAPKQHRAQYLNGFPQRGGNDTTFERIEQMPVLEVPAAGNAHTHNSSPLHDTGSMIMFLLSCLFLITSYRLGNVYISNLAHNMFSIKGKDDLYSDHTMSDTRIIIALIVNTCLMEGMLMFYGLSWYNPQLTLALQSSVFLHVFVLVLAAALFITLQLFLYRLIGFTFSDDRLTELWVGGFLASQATLGLVLFPIVVITLVFPSTIKLMLTLAIVLYILARLVFIWKGFRIFFNNFSSSIYFILYLCAVEIVPPLLALAGTVYVCSIL
ncbi:MAG: DUF4271 domain-containing protein [Muribaculaceae bacterium]|jgi:hypothetical protein|nr:DUF4271 domain-containing protein [Muribaculaceae bacterium]